MRKFIFALTLTAAVNAAACAPRATVPQTELQIPSQLQTSRVSSASVEAAWWRQFDDDVLNGLIEEAFATNRDIAAAAARVVAARELAGAARAAQLPFGGASAGAARQHLSAHEAGGALPDRLHPGAKRSGVTARLRSSSTSTSSRSAPRNSKVRAHQFRDDGHLHCGWHH